ncbi:MAG: hypothetical protein ABSD67_12310 [Terracidiphilus sp.]|jgi:hypothetical protein
MNQEDQLPRLTQEQLETLRRFALLEVCVNELLRQLAGVFEIELEPDRQPDSGLSQRRTATGHFRVPEPGVVITRSHIANALDLKRAGVISERDLVYWATILLLNDAYVLDPGDEDLIAEWLNDISLNLDAS